MSRLSRLAERLTEPLLVTGTTNVLYLTGLSSSNAAVLVEPDGGATIYTDFRYAERARAVEGTDVVEIARDLIGSLGSLFTGRRITIEAPHVSYNTYARFEQAGVELVATGSQIGDIAEGPVEDLRRIKEPGEADAIRRACAISDQVLDELSRQRFTGRTESQIAWWIESAFHDAGAFGAAFPSIVAAGTNGVVATRGAGRPADRGGHARHGRHGLRRRRLLLGLHAHLRHRRAAHTARRGVRALPAGAARRPCRRARGCARAGCRRRLAHGDRGCRPRRPLRPRARARRRAGRPRGAGAARGDGRRARGGKRGQRRAGHLPAGRRGCAGSRISSSSRTTAASG